MQKTITGMIINYPYRSAIINSIIIPSRTCSWQTPVTSFISVWKINRIKSIYLVVNDTDYIYPSLISD